MPVTPNQRSRYTVEATMLLTILEKWSLANRKVDHEGSDHKNAHRKTLLLDNHTTVF
jgi:hypothetical protein